MSSDFGSFVLSLSSRKKNGNLFVTNGVKGIWVVVHFSLSDGKKSIAKRNGSFIASQMQLKWNSIGEHMRYDGFWRARICVHHFGSSVGIIGAVGMIFSALFPVAAVVGILPLLPRA